MDKLLDIIDMMETIDQWAQKHTTDPKVYVGAILGKTSKNGSFKPIAVGCNKNEHYNEKELGQTYREFLFSSRDKKYRPWDKIIHAEENAIVHAINNGKDKKYDTIIVTRYPCEKCAQLLVYKGVKKVYYGRTFKISEETSKIFSDNNVEVIHIKEYIGDTNDDNK